MWRRTVCSQIKTLAAARGAASSSVSSRLPNVHRSLVSPAAPSSPFNRYFSAGTDGALKKPEDVMPIATGHEREELEAELQGKDILDMNFPVGPFGTKEEPAVVKSYYDRRIVGCPGGEEEDEHDVVWFWLEKGKPAECPVCAQYFVLEVEGPGGDWEAGHGDH